MSRDRLFDISIGKVMLHATTACLLIAGAAVSYFASTEKTMGDAQRILYLHVPMAWFGLIAFLVTAITGALYLRSREAEWDYWSQASAEVGWLCLTLTIVTGSIWAHAAWNTWWTWDPRLTTVFILWVINSGYLLLRGNMEDTLQSARFRAVVAIIGALDLPMIVMATRWFRGMHPVAPRMEPGMRVMLLISVAVFSVIFGILLVRRRGHLYLANRIALIKQETD